MITFIAYDVGEYRQDCGYNCSGNRPSSQACDRRDGSCLACAAGFQRIKYDQGLTSNQSNFFFVLKGMDLLKNVCYSPG